MNTCCPGFKALRLVALFLLPAVAGATITFLCLNPGTSTAQEGPDWLKGLPKLPNSKWLKHDTRRPFPKKVEPGPSAGAAPSDALVLFAGKDIGKHFVKGNGKAAEWKVENGYAELNNSGSIRTRKSFGDCQLHLEWANPAKHEGVSQTRGNSGIIFQGRYEVQVLDNYDNRTYADGSVGALYGDLPPLVNAGRKSGAWQTYDIIFRAPRFKDGKVVEKAQATVLLNGVVVQHGSEFLGSVAWRKSAQYKEHGPAPLNIQDHGDGQKMRFRNIWIRELDLSPGVTD